jgi:hypothetical protein
MDCITRVLPTLSYLKTTLVVDTDKLSFALVRNRTGSYDFEDIQDRKFMNLYFVQPWLNRTLEDVTTLLPTLGVIRSVILLDHDPEDPEDEEKVLF